MIYWMTDVIIYKMKNQNAWMTSTIVLSYIKLLIPVYFKRYPGAKVILVMDQFSGRKDSELLDYLRIKDVSVVWVPSGCTGLLQPLDVAINKSFKDAIRKYYNEWLSEALAE